MELDLERTSNLVLARIQQTCEQDRKALARLGWVAFTERLDDTLVAEPLGDRRTSAQTLTELRTANVERRSTRRHLVHRLVLVCVRQIRHHLERHHLDAKLLRVLFDEILRIVRAVKVFALAVLARASVITTNNKVRYTKVLANNRVPQCLTRSSHTHGKWQERKCGHTLRVAGHQALVDTHARVVVDITRLGKANNGMDEDIGLQFTSRTDGQFTVRAVHRVTSLESHDAAPRDLVEVVAQLSWREAQLDVVKVLWLVDGLHSTADVHVLDVVVQKGDGRVGLVIRTHNKLGFARTIDIKQVRHGQNRNDGIVARVTERHTATFLQTQRLHLLLGHIERDGHREQRAVSETHVGKASLIIRLVHEAFERREATGDDELQVTQLALVEDNVRQRFCLFQQRRRDRRIARQEILKNTTVRRIDHDEKIG